MTLPSSSLFFVCFGGSALLGSLLGVADAYTLLTNGVIYTMNPDQPEARAMAFEDTTIVAVGDSSEAVETFLGTSPTDVWDLQGGLVLPGFHDVHVHAVEAGINRDHLCLFDADADLLDLDFFDDFDLLDLDFLDDLEEEKLGDGFLDCDS